MSDQPDILSQRIANQIAMITERVAPATELREVVFLADTPVAIELTIEAGVFDPSRGRSARKMAEAIALMPPQATDKVLEVGCGAGGLSILLAKQYGVTDLTAVDIMPIAMANAAKNFARHGVYAKLAVSDLFAAVADETTKFDYIVFNAPTAHPAALAHDKTGAVTLWDETGTIKSRFIAQAREMIEPHNGKIVMMYSRYKDYDSLTNVDLSGFTQSQLCVTRDNLSEAGVLVLTKPKYPSL